MRQLRRLTLALVLAYAALCAFLFVKQRDLLYPAPRPLPLALDPGATEARLDIDGATVPLWFRLVDEAPTVVFFHGNGGQLQRSVPTGRDANAAGLGFAAVEYPGYGQSTGAGPTETGLLAAARAGLEHLRGTGVAAPACVGHSLGSGVAVAMAAEGRCSALVAISAYTSIADMAQHNYPFVPARWLVLDRFDSVARAAGVTVPALLLHGRDDTQIPSAMGRALAEAIPGAVFELRDAGHNDIVTPSLWARVAAFLRGERGGVGSPG